MSYILYNNEVTKSSKTPLSINDRGLQYGDGIFETMITYSGHIRFIKDHIDRLKRGAKELQLDLTDELLDPEYYFQVVKSLKKKNNIEGECRIKLMLWRQEGGLYTPTGTESNFMISVIPFTPKMNVNALNVDFAETIKVPVTPVSFCKTLSSLTYTFAGLEKKKRELDDLILFNYEGYVAETISGNVFWIKDKIIYTPKICVGCVSGIGRKNIITYLESKGYKVRKVTARKVDLLDADALLTANVTGVTMIKKVGEKHYKIIDAWRKLFEQAYQY
ncbi:aminotransferase class IV [Flammeovirga kamogawensis]|uniref:branched-chain-amino-acid transaminase n=1 Tax=Flammeovirga kamogawensis TaxID=373891 RepID=A0ABX8H064_9BACT|nr:aminotransferase class IV [Flammeovirga kamogawensis]MBB6458996.1 branched-subunit amino acid aminotransferase/4-amino-4-deoxychorismate lyase [Flammeovirga kamogawensis]QWG08570.1 aminotransferase class IV [Flammeovirga kamogawensis]TRX66862.1 hypothetical protein EO216_01475 [Flammeovirga kamogawensis]